MASPSANMAHPRRGRRLTERTLVWSARALVWLLLIILFVNAWFEYHSYSLGW